jgi:hypothetical protein
MRTMTPLGGAVAAVKVTLSCHNMLKRRRKSRRRRRKRKRGRRRRKGMREE